MQGEKRGDDDDEDDEDDAERSLVALMAFVGLVKASKMEQGKIEQKKRTVDNNDACGLITPIVFRERGMFESIAGEGEGERTIKKW